MNICVFCSSSEGLANEYYESGYQVGKVIAENGHTLVFGGYSKGIMGAVAKGCRDHGGEVISVIPEIFVGKRPNFEQGAHVILTKTMSERKDKMAELSDAFFSLPGGIGTFDELFKIIAEVVVGEYHKPIAILMQGQTQEMLGKLLVTGYEEGFIGEGAMKKVGFCQTPEALVEHVSKA